MQFVQWASSMLDSVDQQAQSTVTAIREKKLTVSSLTPTKAFLKQTDDSNKRSDDIYHQDSKQQALSDTVSTSTSHSNTNSEPQSPDIITPVTRSRTLLAGNSGSKRSSSNRSILRSDKKRILVRSVDDNHDDQAQLPSQPYPLNDSVQSQSVTQPQSAQSTEQSHIPLDEAISNAKSLQQLADVNEPQPDSHETPSEHSHGVISAVDNASSDTDLSTITAQHDVVDVEPIITTADVDLPLEQASSDAEPDVDFNSWNEQQLDDPVDVQARPESPHSPIQRQHLNQPEVLVSHANPYDALELSTPGSIDSSYSRYDDVADLRAASDAGSDDAAEYSDDTFDKQSVGRTLDLDDALYSGDLSPDRSISESDLLQPDMVAPHDSTPPGHAESIEQQADDQSVAQPVDDPLHNQLLSSVDTEVYDEHEFDEYEQPDEQSTEVHLDELDSPTKDTAVDHTDQHSIDEQHNNAQEQNQTATPIIDVAGAEESSSSPHEHVPEDDSVIVPVVASVNTEAEIAESKPAQPVAAAAIVPVREHNATASKFAAAFSSFMAPRVNPLAAAITAATSASSDPANNAAVPPVKQLISPSSLSSLRNRLAESEAESASLRNVWNETREQLAKAKKLVTLKEEGYNKRVEQLQEEWRGIVKEQAQSFETKIAELRTSMSNSQADFSAALEAKRAYEQQIENQSKQTQIELAALQQHVEQLQQRTYELEAEKEELTELHHEELANHSQLIARLRAEEAERMAALEAELRARSSSLTRSHHMEHTYDEEQLTALKQAAQAQHDLEERTRQLERAISEKRWLESDHQALQEEVQTMRARFDTEHKQAAAALTSARERNAQLNARIDELSVALSDEQQVHTATQLELTHTRHALDTKLASNAPEDHSNEFEDRIKAMAEHLIAKTSALDRLQAERNSIQLQFEKQVQLVATLEKQLKNAVNDRDDDSDVALDISVPTSRVRRRALPQVDGGVGRAMSALDRVGAQASVLLRRYPAARVVFGLYILIIHLWGCFILVHLVNESGQKINEPFDADNVKHFRGLGNG